MLTTFESYFKQYYVPFKLAADESMKVYVFLYFFDLIYVSTIIKHLRPTAFIHRNNVYKRHQHNCYSTVKSMNTDKPTVNTVQQYITISYSRQLRTYLIFNYHVRPNKLGRSNIKILSIKTTLRCRNVTTDTETCS